LEADFPGFPENPRIADGVAADHDAAAPVSARNLAALAADGDVGRGEHRAAEGGRHGQ